MRLLLAAVRLTALLCGAEGKCWLGMDVVGTYLTDGSVMACVRGGGSGMVGLVVVILSIYCET